jgi:hypothetical protein
MAARQSMVPLLRTRASDPLASKALRNVLASCFKLIETPSRTCLLHRHRMTLLGFHTPCNLASGGLAPSAISVIPTPRRVDLEFARASSHEPDREAFPETTPTR